MFGIGKKPRKRTFKYRVVVKGVTISKHYTKKNANKSASGIRSARVVSIGKRRTKRKTSGKRRY